MSDQQGFSPRERRASFTLAGIFGMRMLGLFMIMPVFALYGDSLEGYSPLWVGIAIGAYGLTQALLQIPAGWLSDRIGRKPVIYAGLGLFAAGSVVAALSDSVYGVVAGRVLQGSGAIAGAILALAADITREENRTKAMAIIGVCIGLSFAVAMVAGPLLAALFGLSGVFWSTALLALVGMVMVRFMLPDSVSKGQIRDVTAAPELLGRLLKDKQLLRLDFGILLLHMTLTAVFVAFPLSLKDAGLVPEHHWWLYLPALMLSFVLIIPFLIIGARRNMNKLLFQASILVMMVALVLMALGQGQLWLLAVAMVLYFTAFNFMEASLPAFLSMLAPAGGKGTAMGIYSTSQFFGAFLGGVLGGALFQQLGGSGVFLLVALTMVLWFWLSAGMTNVSRVRSHILPIGGNMETESARSQLLQRLMALPGVHEALIIPDESAAYLKVDGNIFELDQAKRLVNL
ncbi:major facilitator transporter [Oceanimonas sp. GK1]|uniref:MFS transporter n=1 Tax=Oceanimonas sp. (strain GK1 / IBRC-M 10197) TaxID=511062 RepID=UPI0002494AB0|nr:MFS transporter [Oceanimonas sp. GK1]AEY00570.1 major facilitator transporter [Oceanimonas sp. GK1]